MQLYAKYREHLIANFQSQILVYRSLDEQRKQAAMVSILLLPSRTAAGPTGLLVRPLR
jgi:hypothetical protein